MIYGSEEYIRTLADFGAPRQLTGCKGWILERHVPDGLGLRDAVGPYTTKFTEAFEKLRAA